MKTRLTVIVVVYDMQREAPRTLHSLSAAYQREIDPDSYEVLVVENGSSAPLDRVEVERLGSQFQYFYLDQASASPAPAVNFGLARARGDAICVMIDGARLATPGLLSRGLLATHLDPRAVVVTLGFYLGDELQRIAITKGYTRAEEDALLASIGWPEDGYRLFEICAFDECSYLGWVRPVPESCALFMAKQLWTELGGMDERYDFPGGGLVNLDTLERACELAGTRQVLLLGEGTFHQLHGGVATNSPFSPEWTAKSESWFAQYERLRGRPWSYTFRERVLFGSLPQAFLRRFLQWTANPPPWQIPPRVRQP